MDHDLLWLLHALNTQILNLDEFCALRDAWFPVKPERAQPTAEQAWLDRRSNRHRRRPKRQLHPCLYDQSHRFYRDLTISSQIDREIIRARNRSLDCADQLDDYYADQFTDVPSVGLSVTVPYFGRHIGPYALAEYERGDYADDYDLEEDRDVPDWEYHGFNSEAEYNQYLDVTAELYEDDWHDPSYYDEVARLDDEDVSSDSNLIVFASEEQHDDYHRVFSRN